MTLNEDIKSGIDQALAGDTKPVDMDQFELSGAERLLYRMARGADVMWAKLPWVLGLILFPALGFWLLGQWGAIVFFAVCLLVIQFWFGGDVFWDYVEDEPEAAVSEVDEPVTLELPDRVGARVRFIKEDTPPWVGLVGNTGTVERDGGSVLWVRWDKPVTAETDGHEEWVIGVSANEISLDTTAVSA